MPCPFGDPLFLDRQRGDFGQPFTERLQDLFVF
jgi:hypothetical protein